MLYEQLLDEARLAAASGRQPTQRVAARAGDEDRFSHGEIGATAELVQAGREAGCGTGIHGRPHGRPGYATALD
jgi:hypothetical protein